MESSDRLALHLLVGLDQEGDDGADLFWRRQRRQAAIGLGERMGITAAGLQMRLNEIGDRGELALELRLPGFMNFFRRRRIRGFARSAALFLQAGSDEAERHKPEDEQEKLRTPDAFKRARHPHEGDQNEHCQLQPRDR